MRDTARKIPEIADADVSIETLPLGVHGCDAGAAVKHVGPFGLLVPMQFAKAAGVQAHIHAGNVLGNAEFSHGDLTRPATGSLPHMSVREREAQIRKHALIGGWRNEQVRILPVSGEVARTRIGAAGARA